MKRIECNNASDTLIKALECAGDMEYCVVLYQNREDAPDSTAGFFITKHCTYSTVVWHLEIMKAWLIRQMFE
jgi:hypothetical protein